jgi:crotonobetainyl-CoA:carnitine CoA-transferase CaiB-like acyl-CoA transferase
VVENEHKIAGPLRQARPAALFSGTPTEHRHGGPDLGQHTDEVLAALGYSDDDIAALRQDGVIAGGQDAA